MSTTILLRTCGIALMLALAASADSIGGKPVRGDDLLTAGTDTTQNHDVAQSNPRKASTNAEEASSLSSLPSSSSSAPPRPPPPPSPPIDHGTLASAAAAFVLLGWWILGRIRSITVDIPTPEGIISTHGVPVAKNDQNDAPGIVDAVVDYLAIREEEAQARVPGSHLVSPRHVILTAGIKTTKKKSQSSRPGRTPFVVVSIHGWTASPTELGRFDQDLAAELGAHCYRHRLPGHGFQPVDVGGRALQRHAHPSAMLASTVEAFVVARALGDKVILVGASTGGALATWLAAQPWARPHIHAVFLQAPFYSLNPASSFAVLKIAIRVLPYWATWLLLSAIVYDSDKAPFGWRGFIPSHEEHARFWTCRHPVHATQSLFDLMWVIEANAKAVAGGFAGCIEAPVLVMGNPHDKTVDWSYTLDLVRKMGWKGGRGEEQEGRVWVFETTENVSRAHNFLTSRRYGGSEDGDKVAAKAISIARRFLSSVPAAAKTGNNNDLVTSPAGKEIGSEDRAAGRRSTTRQRAAGRRSSKREAHDD